MAIIGSNVTVEVQQTLGSNLAVTAITKANPGVATLMSHGLTTGDVIVFNVTAGMVELDGQACRVIVDSSSAFQLEGVNTTNYSTYTSGTANEVTAFQTLSSAQNISMPNPAPTRVDITTLINKVKQYTYALPDAPDGSISGLFNPGGTAEGLIFTATQNNAEMVFRISFAGGQKTVFNSNVSGGSGFDLQPNAAATATVSFTPIGNICHYAS
jgi:hypothetical protein